MLDLLTIGRISVDLYGQEEGHGLSDPQTFQKSVGGSPTNVAIGTARYGHKTAVITGVASDALGEFAIGELKKFSVSTEFVIKTPTGKTPIVVAGIKDPDNPEFIFYRDGKPVFNDVYKISNIGDRDDVIKRLKKKGPKYFIKNWFS